MIATTVEQSERLLACGVKADTADMYYRFTDDEGCEIGINEVEDAIDYGHEIFSELKGKDCFDSVSNKYDDASAWSLSALLTRVLPRRLCGTNLNVIFDENECEINYSIEDCIGRIVLLENRYNDSVQVYDSDPIEACVKMVEFLKDCELSFT